MPKLLPVLAAFRKAVVISSGIETLYACENSLIQKDSWRLSQQWQILESYQKRYGNDDFSVRCEISSDVHKLRHSKHPLRIGREA